MQKIVRFDIDDVVLDPESVQARLNQACSGRTGLYRVRGVCAVGGAVYFVLLPLAPDVSAETYVLAYVDDVSDAGFAAVLEERWSAGFDAVGSIAMGESAYVLFARPSHPDYR